MKFNELTVSKQTKPTRVGRGISAGRGKTAGRGTKGQGSRKSSGRAGFEGGQMPIYMRLPKLRGFKSHRVAAENVYTGQLNDVKGVTVDPTSLAEAGLISSPYVNVKLVVKGELTAKKTVKLQSASKSAVETVEKAGGKFERIDRLARTKKASESK
ncbi:MAG TPA: 50S ribosomal protein L15 [Candidatus Saccharimonadales bacterium]|nr:50S ribosomal protein L15 [Candidatus Saccharimonadales bacterium]